MGFILRVNYYCDALNLFFIKKYIIIWKRLKNIELYKYALQ